MIDYFVIITCIWIICALIGIFFYGILVWRWYKHTIHEQQAYETCKDIKKELDKKDSVFKKERSITILICARNEAQKLDRFLPFILKQYIPPNIAVELLVVNDDSKDESQYIIEKWMRRHYFGALKRKKKSWVDKKYSKKSPKSYQKMTFISTFFKKTEKKHIKYLDISFSFRNLLIHNKSNLGKKFALASGVAAARGEFILVTDADCYPNTPYWLYGMLQRQVASQKALDFILGYSPYEKSKKGNLLNNWIRFEALFTLCQYATAAHWKIPYMGVGRNMMYRKTVFTQSYNWKVHADLVSGDDDLFVNAQASGANTGLSLHPDTWVYSLPSTSWKSYFRQKTRHFTTGTRYRFIHKLFLGLWTQSQVWFWLLSPIIFFTTDINLYFLLLFILSFRVVLFTTTFSLLCRTFDSRDLIWSLPLLDIGLAIYYILFAPILMLNINLKTWN